MVAEIKKIDGVVQTQHPMYRVWRGMRDRCRNPNDKDFPNYGGRGISVCEAWDKSFREFVNYMEPRPPSHTLDRIDVNGNYEPGNVRWATAQEQGQNTRFNVKATWNGETKCISEWADLFGINRNTLWHRFQRRGELFPISNAGNNQYKRKE